MLFKPHSHITDLYMELYLIFLRRKWDHSIHVNNSPLPDDSSSSRSDFSLTNIPPVKSFYTDLWALGPATVSSGQL